MREQHERFCREYLVDGDGAGAAIRVGYLPCNASSTARRLLKRPDILERIDQLRNLENRRLSFTRERVIEELGRLAFADPSQLYHPETGEPLRINELPEELAAAVTRVKLVKRSDGTVGHHMAIGAKEKALDMLAKHFNLYEDHQKAGTGDLHVHLDSEDADA